MKNAAPLPPQHVVMDGRELTYSVRPSRTAKRCRIRISAAGGVEVVVPRDAPIEQAGRFLSAHLGWVRDQVAFTQRLGTARRETLPTIPNETTLLLRGRETPVQWEEHTSSASGRVVFLSGVLQARVPVGSATDRAAVLERWLRKQARRDILACVMERSRSLNVTPGRIYVLGQRTKWGGCSRRRNLSFNWRLVQAPPAVLDYIVVHELAHLIEPYHSLRFWLIVRSHCPDFEQHRAWLKDNEWRLTLPS